MAKKTLTNLIEDYAASLADAYYQADQGYGTGPKLALRRLRKTASALNVALVKLGLDPVKGGLYE